MSIAQTKIENASAESLSVVDPNAITINVDGRNIATRKGLMLIEATDNAGIPIPRFCYHKHLSIAANCRMCLVDVERSPKPMPACATPVSEGMIVRTRSDKTRNAQKAVMEFLLINHPLDCPICDQGGECELQDLSVAYGKDDSLFVEEKLVALDPDLGALIETHMTRCIACTRCVRFGDEIAGLREMGATGRGDSVRIGTHVDKELVSEISANIIDICPVGALTAKPSKYQARPWEYVAHDSLSIHDGLGTNTSIHTLRGKIARVVPRENQALNDVWISDRDRFSYEAIFSKDRVLAPLVKMGEQGIKEASWQNAFSASRMALEGVLSHYGPEQVGVLISPSATVEEMYLAQKFVRNLGIHNIDHRLSQVDFSDDLNDPIYPSLGLDIEDINNLKSVFLVGADLRMEAPLLGIRMRSAVKKNQAKVAMLASYDADQLHAIQHSEILAPHDWVHFLSEVLLAVRLVSGSSKAATSKEISLSHSLDALVADVMVGAHAQILANTLVANVQDDIDLQENDSVHSWLVLGQEAMSHPEFTNIRALCEAISLACNMQFGMLSKGANAVGGYLAGALPHRLPAGKKSLKQGLNTAQMLDRPLKAYILVGAIDPEYDFTRLQLCNLQASEVVISLVPFANSVMRSLSTVILPVAAWGETAGSLINLEGRCQTVSGAAAPQGEARPLWKVLRVLANQFELSGFEYISVDDIYNEWLALCDDLGEVTNFVGYATGPRYLSKVPDIYWVTYQGVYQSDAYVRRSPSLQKTPLSNILKVTLHPETANFLKLAKVISHHQQEMPVRTTEKMARKCVRIAQGFMPNEPVAYHSFSLGAE